VLDPGEGTAPAAQEAAVRSRAIGVEAHDLAAVVDVADADCGPGGAGEIERRVAASAVAHEAVDRVGVGVGADDLAAVVDVAELAAGGARWLDRGEAAALVPQIAAERDGRRRVGRVRLRPGIRRCRR
jgi:hypothetical protein